MAGLRPFGRPCPDRKRDPGILLQPEFAFAQTDFSAKRRADAENLEHRATRPLIGKKLKAFISYNKTADRQLSRALSLWSQW